jgi:RimJ/RimL family protein N-acetyltransferase
MTTSLPLLLVGEVVRLEPLSEAHASALLLAASEDRSSYALTRVPSTDAEMEAYIGTALDQQSKGESIPYVVRRVKDMQVIGTTRFLDFGYWRIAGDMGAGPSVAEIGSTWLSASAQRTGVNVESKLLMLSCAFDVWGAYRVTLQTDARNKRSREAIERIGATLDGVLRAHKLAADGTPRDTASFSLLAAEWPDARARLEERLHRR